MKINVLSMEYPGYGIYRGTPDEDIILRNALGVWEWVVGGWGIGIDPVNVIVFGRSLGSGPAVWLAGVREPGVVLLMSAFTGIKAVARSFAGVIGGWLVKDRFDNVGRIGNVKCPIFFIHGMKDGIVPFGHSEILFDRVNVPTELYMPKNMTHDSFSYAREMTTPFMNFLNKIYYSFGPDADGAGLELPHS
jgi:fermentation-respiration switch protein FrsA (DUF1100 family)